MNKLTFAALLLIACAPLALAQGTYTQIDYPGAGGTYAAGINDSGEVSGSYSDSKGSSHGYIWSNGVFTVVEPACNTSTYLYGLNNLGQVVGYYVSTCRQGGWHGIIYNPATQKFNEIDYPGGSDTVPTGINDSGTIVGYYLNSEGFELTGSTYTQIHPPGAHYVYPQGISASGEVVISTFEGQNFQNFSFQDGHYAEIKLPLPQGVTGVLGISADGSAICGEYNNSTGHEIGFVYRNGLLQKFEFPGAMDTWVYTINSTGVVVGSYYDASYREHGFLWTPPAPDASK